MWLCVLWLVLLLVVVCAYRLKSCVLHPIAHSEKALERHWRGSGDALKRLGEALEKLQGGFVEGLEGLVNGSAMVLKRLWKGSREADESL